MPVWPRIAKQGYEHFTFEALHMFQGYVQGSYTSVGQSTRTSHRWRWKALLLQRLQQRRLWQIQRGRLALSAQQLN
jgi:hypothetical protein